MNASTEIYEEAVAAIAAGRFGEGARLAYEAAFVAVVDAASRHGVSGVNDDEAAAEFLIRLDNPPYPLEEWHKHYDPTGRNPMPIPAYFAGFGVALSFKKHAATLVQQPDGESALHWDQDEYALYLTVVQVLIDDLNNAARPNDGAATPLLSCIKSAGARSEASQ